MKLTAVPPPNLKPIGIERLLHWTFGDQKAQLDPPSRRVVIPRHLGYGSLQNALLEMAALGVRVDVSRAGARFMVSQDVADDALAVVAVVAGFLERRMAEVVATCARDGIRPTAMADSEPACEAADWNDNPHAKTGKTAPAKPTDFPGGVWRPWMEADRKKAKGTGRHLGMCTPVQYRPHPAQIKSARAAYVAWWQALHQVREALIEGRVLRSHLLTRELPPAFPWLKPGEVGIVEVGERPEWR